MMRNLLAAALVLGCAGPALATPAFLPQQDVVVTYQLNVPNQAPAELRLLYDAADQRARVENTSMGYAVLADLPAGHALVVLPSLHALVKAPDFSSLTQTILHADGARFTPEGSGSYAGLACTRYHVQATQGEGEACITHDGVVLHFNGHDSHGSAEVTAETVDYRPVGPQAVAPPAGYSNISLPPGMLASLLNPH